MRVDMSDRRRWRRAASKRPARRGRHPMTGLVPSVHRTTAARSGAWG